MPPKNAKTSSCEDDPAVTMTVLSQLLEQQREFYKEMLLQQQENFKCFIQLIMDGTNKRLDGVIRDVQELKTSLEFTQDKLEEMRMGHKDMETKIKSFENNIMGSKLEMDEMFAKLDYIENQCRRTNILVDGIADEKGETWSDSEKKVRLMISSNLGLDGTSIDIERAQRIGQYQEGGRPRKIVVKFLRLKDRQCILSSTKKLKGTNIYINEDFSEAVQLRRKELLPKLKAARERGDIASLKFDKLVIRPRGGQTQSSS